MIEIVPAITEHNWHSCVILTFGADLPFYEDVVLRELWGKGCRNNLVIVDNSRYGDTLQAERGAIKWIGQRYVCQPIAMASGLRAFHPKVIMLAGTTFGRLLIGSGNLGFRGYGRNWEVFTQFDIGPDEEDRGYAPLFISAVEMLDTLAKEYGFWPQSRRMIEKMRHLSPWLLQPGKIDSPARVSLLHNLTSSLLSQLADQLQDHDVTEITVASPFFDADCKTFTTINRLFHPERIKVVIQQDTSDLQVKRLKQLAETEDMPIRTYLFDVPADRRYLHAKLTIFKTPDAAWCISGSANFTRPGMQLTAGEGNFEVAVLHHAESPDGFDVLLENKIAAVARSSDAIRARPPRPPLVGNLPDMRHLEAHMD